MSMKVQYINILNEDILRYLEDELAKIESKIGSFLKGKFLEIDEGIIIF